ncbi:hypothetical protein [Chromohalobacter israelensis]|uniref:hypothetical protein n=1 Tax=Chromohalobacter israelensis TaxID=141390 RepID=UPI000FFEA7B3|nr:hypothetical protein [Chromohalobacter salexigens]RXE48692.1 hypothetical protein B4O83_12220 [Chromohalobacter salexigens]
MALINRSFIADIKNSLNTKQFSEFEFDIDTPETGSVLVRIHHKDHNEMYISLYEGREHKEIRETTGGALTAAILPQYQTNEHIDTINVSMTPGQYKTKESYKIDSATRFISEIHDWLGNLSSELTHLTVKENNETQTIYEEFYAQLNEQIPSNDEVFSNQEANQLNEKLDKLYKRIEELQETYSIQEEKLNAFEEVIESVKMSAYSDTKKRFLRVSAGKISRSLYETFKTPEGRQFLLGAVTQFTQTLVKP